MIIDINIQADTESDSSIEIEPGVDRWVKITMKTDDDQSIYFELDNYGDF